MLTHKKTLSPRFEIDSATAHTILRLRVLIARAAQPDSLQWWQDQSLTQDGMYVVERLFARNPKWAAAHLAIASSRARHWAAIPREPNVTHLFDLGNPIEFALADFRIETEWIPNPPASMDDFIMAIGEIVPDGAGYESGAPDTNGALEIHLLPEREHLLPILLARVSALALAYSGAERGQPIFPFLRIGV